MACIYYISNKKDSKFANGVYIGQDSGDSYERIQFHVTKAYIKEGKTSEYGSETLIRNNSASKCHFAAWGGDYGISKETYDGFLAVWGNGLTYDTLTPQTKLDAAEILHILYNVITKGRKSVLNIQIGGQGNLPFQFNYDEITKNALRDMQRDLNWKIGTGKDAGTLTLNRFENADDFNKLLFPVDYRVLEMSMSHAVEEITQSPDFKKILVTWMLEEINSKKTLEEMRKKDYFSEALSTKIKHFLNKHLVSKLNDNIKLYFNKNLEVSFTAEDLDIDNIADRILSSLYKRFKTLKSIQIQWDVTINDIKANRRKNIKELINVLTHLLNNWGKEVTAEPIRIHFPSNWTKSIKIRGSRQYPQWFESLKKDLKQLDFNSQSEQIESVVKSTSYTCFKHYVLQAIKEGNGPQIDTSIYEGVFSHTRGQKHKRGELWEQFPESLQEVTLRDKVHEQYVNVAEVHGDILKNWNQFYRSMITCWLIKEQGKRLEEQQQEDRIALEDFNMISVWNQRERIYHLLPETWKLIQSYQGKIGDGNTDALWIY